MPEWYIAAIVFRSNAFRAVFTVFLSIAAFAVVPAKASDRRPLFSIFDAPVRPADSLLFAEKDSMFFDDFPLSSSANSSAKARAFVNAPAIMQDGERQEFFARITGGEAAAYEWSFETPGKAKTPALIEFSSPNAAATQVLARWYARTRGGCSAEFTSRYLVKLKVKLQNGNELTERFPLTVEVPHNWGGYVDYPETAGVPQIVFDETNRLWHVKSAGTLARVVKEPVIRAAKESQFFNKIKTHEEIHHRQMQTGIFADLFQIDVLLPLIAELSDADRRQLEQKIFETIQAWRANEARRAIARLSKAEKEAYAVSDQIAPRYLFNNCERFK